MKFAYKLTILAWLFPVILCLSGIAAADKESVPGRDLYREYCRDCHTVDSDFGEYTPLSLIQDQWVRFFDKKYERAHRKVMDEKHGGKPVLEAISPEDLELIKGFSIDHAADSEQPMTCG